MTVARTCGFTWLLAFAACAGPASPTPTQNEFVVEYAGERFVVRIENPETVRLAEENMAGRNTRFPSGQVKPGHGGFNAPWTWHLDPVTVLFVDVATELCDAPPSYVEAHLSEFPVYCPWGAKVVGRR